MNARCSAGPIPFWMKSSEKYEISWWTGSSLGGKKYPLPCWWASMKNTPGYLLISGSIDLFSIWFCVPKSRLGSNPNAVVRVTPSRPSGLRTGC